jgi:methionyl aminopeptidase
MENDRDMDELKLVGRISAEALLYAKTLVKPGAKLIDIAEKVEEYVTEKGCGFAFPINLSANQEAAHYTPKFGDDRIVKDGDVIKVDLGARKTDSIVDCAATVSLSDSYAGMAEACDSALEGALGIVKAGIKVSEIGREVDRIISAKGFKTVKNLGGHGVAKGELHADVFIPNFDNGDATELSDGQLVAVEVFITDGDGAVKEGDEVQIFRKYAGATARNNSLRKVSDFIDRSYSTYPFALRWLVREFSSEFTARAAISDLARSGSVEQFPVLVERSGGIVAQSEKTVLVGKDSCDVIT